jgi:hypothetical protein
MERAHTCLQHACTNIRTLLELNHYLELALQLAFIFESLSLHPLSIVRIVCISLTLLGNLHEKLRRA